MDLYLYLENSSNFRFLITNYITYSHYTSNDYLTQKNINRTPNLTSRSEHTFYKLLVDCNACDGPNIT